MKNNLKGFLKRKKKKLAKQKKECSGIRHAYDIKTFNRCCITELIRRGLRNPTKDTLFYCPKCECTIRFNAKEEYYYGDAHLKHQ